MKRIILALLILSGTIPSAFAAQLDAKILVDEESFSPTFSFLRIIYIEYPEGGEISELLRGTEKRITFSADSRTSDLKLLLNNINESYESLPSSVFVTDAMVNYQAILSGNQDSAVIELKLQLIPTLTNSVISQQGDLRTIDANWRGLSLDSPVIMQTEYGKLDINNPKEALNLMIPNVMKKINEKEIDILEIPLINSSEIIKLPLYRWHSLFDNTAIIASSEQFNFTGKYVQTHYSMGECNLEIGFCEDRKWIHDLELDKKYRIVMIESRDDASITVEGYSNFTTLGPLEVFEASISAPVKEKPATDEFPALVMYGMAGIAAIGGMTMFVFSNRKLKKDQEQGQTGIDPAHLIAYETSNSSGGYKTNRGETVLKKNTPKTPV